MINLSAELRHQFSTHRLIRHRQKELDRLLRIWHRHGLSDAQIQHLVDEAVELGALNP
jgi:hypothetical protein